MEENEKVTVAKVEAPVKKIVKARLKQPWTWAGALAIVGSVLMDPTMLHLVSSYFMAVEAGRGWIGAIGIAFGSAVMFWQQQHPVVSVDPAVTDNVVRAAATAGIAARLISHVWKRRQRDDRPSA